MADSNFAESIHDQFGQALAGGISEFTCNLPVVSLDSNRMTLGTVAADLPRAAHDFSLRRHPTGIIRAAIESPYGLACPDPLVAMGMRVSELPADVVVQNPNVSNHLGLLIVSSPVSLKFLAADFDGNYRRLKGMDRDAQKLFAAQVAGAALKQLRAKK